MPTLFRLRPVGCGLHGLLLVSMVFGLALPACAHELFPGVTGFPSLVLHSLLEPAVMLVLLSAGLVLAPGSGRAALFGIPLLATAGVLVGMMMQPMLLAVPGLWRLPLIVAVVAAGLAAAAVNLPATAVAGVVFAAAAMAGLALTPERPGRAGAIEALAAGALAAVLVMLPSGWLARAFGGIAGGMVPRVAGAWIVAIALLTLAAGLPR